MSLMAKNTLYLGFFVIVTFSTLTTVSQIYLALTRSYSALNRTSFEATSIPWINTQIECEHSGRNWQNNQCWDAEHSPTF